MLNSLPGLSLSALSFLRTAYGALLFLTLLSFLPHYKRFFLNEKWGGYIDKTKVSAIVHHPLVFPFLFAIWLMASLVIISGKWCVWAAFINFLFCRYHFIDLRWASISRGMGAPGYITYWLGACLFFLEFTSHYAPSLMPVALWVMQVDFALIFFLSGLYKFKSGYRHGMGMEFGLVNPQWGYHWSWIKQTIPSHWMHRLNNHLAWSLEMLTALCMLTPPLRWIGGCLLIISFIYISLFVRLGFLPEMVMLIGVLYFTPGSYGDVWIQSLFHAFPPSTAPAIALPSIWIPCLKGAFLGYLLLLPIAYGGLCYNLYWKKSLPGQLQVWLEKYTNFFGMILWRVFSVDVTNFFIRIYRRDKKQKILLSQWGWNRKWRWGHVCEAITITSVFTALKYYPHNRRIFEQRLRRYANTLPHQKGDLLIFEYLTIDKKKSEFHFLPTAEFHLFSDTGSIQEISFDSSALTSPLSPLHEGVKPGSYIPLNPR